jgi:serine/threonine protein kinase
MNSAPRSLPTSTYAVVGRYAIFDEIASGGMATVHLGRLLGDGGFSRIVAIKRLHPQFVRDQEFAAMFMDEALLAARISHPNVVPTLDVVTIDKELLLVMEYVHGASLATLLAAARRTGQRVSPRLIAGVVVGALEGLHAAHEARSEAGTPLGVVHRDVSPQNILVGSEGTARILDFGVAKAMGKIHSTREGQLKGKLAYMSPEQVRGVEVTRQSDLFSMAIVLWEALTAERLFTGSNPAELILNVLDSPIPLPRTKVPELSEALEAVVMKGLSRPVASRYASAREMALAIEGAVEIASQRETARWVESLSGEMLGARTQLLSYIEKNATALLAGAGAKTTSPGTPEQPSIQSEQRAKPTPSRDEPASGTVPRAPAEPALGTPRPEGLACDDTTPKNPKPGYGAGGAASGKRDSERPGAPLPIAGSQAVSLPIAGGQAVPLPIAGAQAGPRAAPLGGMDPIGELPLGSGRGPAEARPPDGLQVARPRPIPRPIAEPTTADHHASLRERLEWPIRLVAAGVVISLLDWAVREYTAALPVRPMWIASALVIVGVVWAFARVFLQSIFDGSRE